MVFIVLFAMQMHRVRRREHAHCEVLPLRILCVRVQSIQKYRNAVARGVINQKWSSARKEERSARGGIEGVKDREGSVANINKAARQSTQKPKQMLHRPSQKVGNVC